MWWCVNKLVWKLASTKKESVLEVISQDRCIYVIKVCEVCVSRYMQDCVRPLLRVPMDRSCF